MTTKLLSILLSGLMLVQSVEIDFDDIIQFDEFLEHARFHSEKYGDNFLIFISKHYGELKEQHSKDHQEEQRDHEKLPFQHHCSCSSITAFFFDTSFSGLISLQIRDISTSDFYYQAHTSSLHAKGLLQPPQFA
jgi:hypothetical protein